jgi:hypothetical protein
LTGVQLERGLQPGAATLILQGIAEQKNVQIAINASMGATL